MDHTGNCAIQQRDVWFLHLSLEQGPQNSVSVWSKVYFLPIFPTREQGTRLCFCLITLQKNAAQGYSTKPFPIASLVSNLCLSSLEQGQLPGFSVAHPHTTIFDRSAFLGCVLILGLS